MIDINSIVIDSAMSFTEAVDGSTAPLEVIDSLSMVDVTYYSFNGLRHSGQIVVDARLEDDIYQIFQLIERLKFPVGKAIPIAAYHWEDGDSMGDAFSDSGISAWILATDGWRYPLLPAHQNRCVTFRGFQLIKQKGEGS